MIPHLRDRPANKQVTAGLVMFVILQTLLTEGCTFSTLHQRFICIHLHYPYLTSSWHSLFHNAQYLGFRHRRTPLWWFDALPCRTTPVGRFHHLVNSSVTTFSRSLLSAHIWAVAWVGTDNCKQVLTRGKSAGFSK